MPIVQQIFFYLISLVILGVTLNLVRLRMLRENYSLLWIFIAISLFLIIIFYPVLVFVSNFFEADPTSMLMFCGVIAILLLILQLTLNVSSQSKQIKDMAQKIAILEENNNRLK